MTIIISIIIIFIGKSWDFEHYLEIISTSKFFQKVSKLHEPRGRMEF